MDFLPDNFQLAMPFHSQLRVRHGTDGQTDDSHQLLMRPPYGDRGIIIIIIISEFIGRRMVV